MIVDIDILFSKKCKIGSMIIAKGTKHLAPNVSECSHVALLVNNRFVLESTLDKGVHVSSYNKWLSENIQVDKIYYGQIDYKEIAYLYRFINEKKYDWLGLIYLALNIIPTFFNLPMSSENKWECPNKYFCTEAVGYLTNEYYGMTTPNQILNQMRSVK